MPSFPDVPNVPGVPALLRDPSQIIAIPTMLLQDNLQALGSLFGVDQPTQWGLFKDGELVVTADNVLAVEYKQDWSIADYPIEMGGFESYDKVNTPFNARIRFSSGGSEQNRQSLLSSIAYVAGTLDLYDLYTPEVKLPNVSIMHYDYRREASQGVGLIIVEVGVLEIRTTAESTFSNTKSPSGADTVDGGTVQPQAPTNQETGVVNSGSIG